MAQLGLREAAKQVGVSRQTIYRLVKTGKLSATVGHDGQKLVDTAELLRVFGKLDAASGTPPAPPAVTGATVSQPATPLLDETGPRQPETAVRQPAPPIVAMSAADRRREYEVSDRASLAAELAAAKERLRDLENQLDEAKARELRLTELAASATRLLEHRELATSPQGFWRRLFGK